MADKAKTQPNDSKAELILETGGPIPCTFNPSEFSITKSASWQPAKAKGKDTPILNFQQGNPGTMSLTLTLDTTGSGNPVTDLTKQLFSLLKADPGLTQGKGKHNNSGRPPWCQFHWGGFHSFKAVVENLQVKFTYFSSSGVPLRAVATLSLKQQFDPQGWPQNPTSGTPHPHQVHWLLPGQTLDRVAADVYGDSGKWRLIAEANGILDPLDLPWGDAIVVPDLEAGSRA
jgi:hypothetical protein